MTKKIRQGLCFASDLLQVDQFRDSGIADGAGVPARGRPTCGVMRDEHRVVEMESQDLITIVRHAQHVKCRRDVPAVGAKHNGALFLAGTHRID